ncbi:MAG: hypothetical protein J0I09_13240 [Sphingobacteriia bacterium]|nr:hypothetical protein [Sphingobacteriia bacterium]
MAQDTIPVNKYDTSFFLANKKGWVGKLGKMIAINPNNNKKDSLPVLINNIDPYVLYKGAIIRNVELVNIGFGQSITDTSFKNKNALTRIADELHTVTRKNAITNNLFFRKGDSLNPYLLGDNERFLRQLPYLQDAKITIREISDDYDSIDVVILYKDLFSISGTVDASGNTLFFQAQDDNISGYGDRLQISTLADPNRNPPFGLGVEYLKRNIEGSFVNFTIGYQSLNNAFNNGLRQETAIYSRLDLPLVTPYYLWTGALEVGERYTQNNYVSDSLYNSDYKYNYQYYDGWAGYNISAKKQLHEFDYRKPKSFLALRLAQTNFSDIPNIYKAQYNFKYANLTSTLLSYTLFKQTYYHTNYIYGFGKYEDVPAGFNVSGIIGWTDKNNYQRPYAGANLQRNYFSKKQNYFNFNFTAGGYFREGRFEDFGILFYLESFSSLKKLNKKWFHRNFINGSLAGQYNIFLNEPLRINSSYGIASYAEIPNYNANMRATFNYESVFYSNWKVIGFGVAPFIGGTTCYLKPMGTHFFNGDLFSTISGGFRTRNEALIFGTVEFRLNYYPRTTINMSNWSFSITTDLRFQYNSVFIKRPDFVTLN